VLLNIQFLVELTGIEPVLCTHATPEGWNLTFGVEGSKEPTQDSVRGSFCLTANKGISRHILNLFWRKKYLQYYYTTLFSVVNVFLK
jgi:hypothetical protein